VKHPWIGRGAAICMAGLIVFCPRTALAQQLELSFKAGRVTLDARDVTIRQILDEWARRGEVIIGNAELVGDRRVSLQLDAVPERQAMDAVLGSVAGYVIVARGADSAGPSIFGRMFLVARSAWPDATVSANDRDALAITRSGAVLAELPIPRDAIESGEPPNSASDTASDQAPESRFSLVNAESPDGRPAAARPASVNGMRGPTPPTGSTSATSTVVEPPNGRPESTPTPGNAIRRPSAPAPAISPGTSTIEKPPAGLVKDVNGRETTK
jgi:hypothetical protein